MKEYGFAISRVLTGWALVATAALSAAALGAGPNRLETESALARMGQAFATAAEGWKRGPVAPGAPFDVEAVPPHDVKGALAQAAELTGVSRPYLVSTARRESNLNPRAAAASSSARGLFQFVESTWLEMVDKHGAKYGLAREAALVRYDRSGRPRIADPAERRRVLDLRFDPRLSALLAGELTRQNAEALSDGLRRTPTDGELYVAHFLGAKDAVRLIKTAERHPQRVAAELFPGAARSNRAIFYRGKHARTAAEVLERLT